MVLLSAAGLRLPEHPIADLFIMTPEQLVGALFQDTTKSPFPTDPDVDAVLAFYRDMTGLARFSWAPFLNNPKLERRVHRITAPTLVVWPSGVVRRWYDGYREAARELGYVPEPEKLALSIPIYVAETDDQAHREGRQHLMWLFHKGLKQGPEIMFPPGYMTPSSMRGLLMAGHETLPRVDLRGVAHVNALTAPQWTESHAVAGPRRRSTYPENARSLPSNGTKIIFGTCGGRGRSETFRRLVYKPLSDAERFSVTSRRILSAERDCERFVRGC